MPRAPPQGETEGITFTEEQRRRLGHWAPEQLAHLRSILGPSPLATVAITLASTGLAPSTVGGYSDNWAAFVRFCTSHNLCPLPASEATCILYVAHLAEKGTVQPGSLQPYLSAVNRVHVDTGFVGPAAGSLLDSVRKGWEQRRADEPANLKPERRPLPAPIALQALQATTPLLAAFHSGEHMDASLFRALLYVGFGFQLMARADTDAHLAIQDLVLIPQRHGAVWRIVLRHEKGRRRNAVRRTLDLPRSGIPAELSLALDSWTFIRLRAWAAAGVPPPRPDSARSFWRLPGDALSRSSSDLCNGWLSTTLAHLGVSAPPGFVYNSHSLRSGAASAAAALGVQLKVIMYWGGWKSPNVVLKQYIDPTVTATLAGQAFFGWLAPPRLLGHLI